MIHASSAFLHFLNFHHVVYVFNVSLLVFERFLHLPNQQSQSPEGSNEWIITVIIMYHVCPVIRL